MNVLPPSSPLPRPVPDPRARGVVLDHADTHGPVADLVLPGDASMRVMSVLETSRERVRHSYDGTSPRPSPSRTCLWGRIADLDETAPLINAEYHAAYFTRLRTMAQVAAAGRVPAAT
ncbi:hypothetical protein [Streptomyces sp. NPDC057426]|uniref:hypothetical protein n=1 Tax=Streptomyces sp. NPDC057426 TaxID=3346128 RepID=UPI0036988B39